ncbi:MAG: diguanylate cyclase/phosphodiesterase [Solirubrobacterales bacterium]|nr:diguanylate cyclase/phosphodiesterase [Solirubrobacterales bacterium]
MRRSDQHPSCSPREELGWALYASADQIAEGVLSRLSEDCGSGELAGDEDLLQAIARTDVEATKVLGRWIATGEQASREEMDRLGELGVLADRLPLCHLVKAYLAWRDVVRAVLDRKVQSLGIEAEPSAEIRQMIARSCDASLVRMARRFDGQREGLQEQLEQMALHDHLTGLANRRLLADRLDRALRTCRRSGDMVAVCFIDLDGFKAVNDALGHDAGDRLLRALADRLLAAAGGSDTAARVGGDEFVILCQQSDDEVPPGELARRILARIELPCTIDDHDVRVAASIGVALGGADDDAASLLAQADAAMYLAKQRGGGRHELYSSEIAPRVSRRVTPRRNRDFTVTKGGERGSQDSNLESPVLETGALASWATAPEGAGS